MRLNKELAKRILADVPEDRKFSSSDGQIFSTLKDLEKGIKAMNDEVFLHHTGEGRNDFSNWISECLGDVRLADSLVGLNKNTALKKIRSRISHIERYLEKAL